MYGAVIGDILGSKYEFHNIKTKDFRLFTNDMFFTDDTVLTCAVCETLLDGTPIRDSMMKWVKRYPKMSYGGGFLNWVIGGMKGNNPSCGNGSAMRVSPVGLWAKDEREVKALARAVTVPSHNSEGGLKGAEATAMMVWLAKNGASRMAMNRAFREYYPEPVSLEALRGDLSYWGELCENTVPQAMECFFRSTSFEDCMRNCISIGGDSDTIGAIAGGVSEAYYGVPEPFLVELGGYLPRDVKNMLRRFYEAV